MHQWFKCRDCDNERNIIMRSDFVVSLIGDRYLWWRSIRGSLSYYWRRAIEEIRLEVEEQRQSRRRRAAAVRLLCSETTSEHIDPLRMLFLEADDLGCAIEGLKASMRQSQVEGRITFIAASTRALKSVLRDPYVLKDIMESCAVRKKPSPGLLWHSTGTQIPSESDSAARSKALDETRNFLFAHSTEERERVQIYAGDVRILRWKAGDDSLDKKLSLASLLHVPPDTPGLDERMGTIEIDAAYDVVCLATPFSFPANGLGNGILLTALYARRALMQPGGLMVPGRLRVHGCVVTLRDNITIDGCAVDVSALQTSRFLLQEGSVEKVYRSDVLWTSRMGDILTYSQTFIDINFNGNVDYFFDFVYKDLLS